MPCAVIFDIDGTLYDYSAAHVYAFRALSDYAAKALGLTAERFETLHDWADERLRAHTGGHCAAIHDRLIRYQLMLERLGLSIAHAPKMERLYWSTLIGHMAPNPGLHEAFDWIKARGLRLGVGTNMTANWQFAKLERLGVLGQVDFMVTSEEAGAEKPDRRLFALCAEKAGTVPERCVFVGDSLTNDAAAANAAGMLGVWYRPGAGQAPDGVLTVGSISALPALLISSEGRTTV